ncbi:MAG: SDR family NAD(P)-dependent oxidoreductase [Planctomycetes bacterium]|nr:SDR family NAD(P)-dependent oxidoreductase [Planctomycetota bacterium]
MRFDGRKREHEFAGRKPTPKELKQSTARHLGRREIRRNLKRIEDAGAIARYCAVDVCDSDAIRELLADVTAKFGPVRGLIHGAGVIEDKKIENKTPEQFGAVFDTKVCGLRNVLDAIDISLLRSVVMFSSVSGRCGNVGQADYAAANEVLNKASQRLAGMLPEARVVSINWGPWDGGMVHPALRQEFVNHGLKLIPVEDGAELVADELSFGGGEAEVIVGADFDSAGKGDTKRTAVAPSAAAAVGASDMTPAFERLLDISGHPFLLSHVIDGRPVLPAAMMMEWLSHAAMHAHPGLQLQGLSEFRVLKGVIVRERAPLLRLYSGAARRSGDVFDVDVELRSAGETPSAPEVIHAKATAVLTTRLATPARFEARPELIDRAYERGAHRAYADVLFHGETFQGIERVEGYSADGTVVRVRPSPAASEWMVDPLRSHWLTDPLVVDCAFQAAILWSVEEAGGPCLPSVVRSYRQYRSAFPWEPVSLVLEVVQKERHRCVLDVTVLARDGGVVAKMEGVECTIDANLEKAFRRRALAEVPGAAHQGA